MSLAERKDMTDKEKALIDAVCIPNGDITINQVLEQVWLMSHKLGQYMAVGTVEEFKKLKELLDEKLYEKLIYSKVKEEAYNKAIDDFVTVILAKFTEAERNGNFRFYASELKQSIADLGEQLKS